MRKPANKFAGFSMIVAGGDWLLLGGSGAGEPRTRVVVAHVDAGATDTDDDT